MRNGSAFFGSEVRVMPRTKKGTPPSYRRHSGGQAVVTVRTVVGVRRDILLGPWNSPESFSEYSRVLAVLQAHGGRYPVGGAAAGDPEAVSVNEVLLAFLRDAENRYGATSKEVKHFRYAVRPVKELFGTLPAAQFSPKRLKAVRKRMIDAQLVRVRCTDAENSWEAWLPEAELRPRPGEPGVLEARRKRDRKWFPAEAVAWKQAYCRNLINRRVSRIKAVFGWAVSDELVPGSVAHALREVKGLRQCEEHVRESPPVKPAFEADLLWAVPFCPGPVGAMLRLQWLTGMRSGEVRIMRTLDIDRGDPARWVYRPGSDAGPHGKHKNAWRGQDRIVPMGPAAIELLTPWLRPDDPSAYLFRPQAAVDERNAKRRAERKTRRQPSQLARKRKRRPKRAPGDCYTEESYPRAVARACAKAGVTFHPYALRHGRKMSIERSEGTEAARCVLGQKSIVSTTHYGVLDTERAKEVMGRRG
jgi:integrase